MSSRRSTIATFLLCLALFTTACNVAGQASTPAPPSVPAGQAVLPTIKARTIILVRHGEVDLKNKDAGLTPEGLRRAEDLAVALKDAGVTKIFTSEKLRTQQTAEALAKQLKIAGDPGIPQMSKMPEILGYIRDHIGKDDVVLIVYHSYSIPGMVKALTGMAEGPVADETFDNLFVFTPDATGTRYRLVHGRYGAPSPAPAAAPVKTAP